MFGCEDDRMEPAAARERLGELVRERREKLGLSVRRAAKLGGIDRLTWTSLEQGDRLTHGHNHTKVEGVLRWASGSIASILNGGEPTIEEPPTRVDVARQSALANNMLVDVRYISHMDAPALTRADLIHLLVTTYKEAEEELLQAQAGAPEPPLA